MQLQKEFLLKKHALNCISNNKKYLDLYNHCLCLYENNEDFRSDCLMTSRLMLANFSLQYFEVFVLREVMIKYNGPGSFFKSDLRGQIFQLLLHYRHYVTQELVGHAV